MDLKKLIKSKQYDIKSLSIKTGIPYSTLNDFVNGKTSVYKMQYGYVKKISDILGISVDKLVKLSDSENISTYFGKIIVKNKSYYLNLTGTDNLLYLCKVNSFNKDYVKTLAEWEYEYIKNKEKEEKWINTFPLS